MTERNADRIDARCLACSLPLVKLAAEVRGGCSGEIFEAFSDTPGFLEDVKLWSLRTGHAIIGHLQDPTGTTVVVRKR